jgi:hypothetical protein
MTTITLFEYQKRGYAELGLSVHHPAVERIAQLNETSSAELIRLGHQTLRATQYVDVIRVGGVTLSGENRETTSSSRWPSSRSDEAVDRQPLRSEMMSDLEGHRLEP